MTGLAVPRIDARSFSWLAYQLISCICYIGAVICNIGAVMVITHLYFADRKEDRKVWYGEYSQ